MSPQARLLNGIQLTALSDGVGQELSALTEKTLVAITDKIGEYATSVLGDVAQAVPFIGTAISLIATVWESEQASDAQKKAALAQACNWGPPAGSASGLRVVPADLFAPFYGVDGYFSSNAPPKVRWDLAALPVIEPAFIGTPGYRSFIGQQLISVTESPIDYGSGGSFVDDYAYDLMKTSARLWLGQKNLGVPPDKRALFTKLRMAMQAAWRPPYGSPLLPLGRLPGTPFPYPGENVSDGGASLLPAYLDLLSTEIDQGHITPEMLAFFDSHLVIKPGHAGEPNRGQVEERIPDAPGCYQATWNLVNAWRSTIHPAYTQDVAAQKELQAEVDQALVNATGKVQLGSVWLSYAKAASDRTRANALLGVGIVLTLGGVYALYNPAHALVLYRQALALGTKGYHQTLGVASKATGVVKSYGASAVQGARSLVR